MRSKGTATLVVVAVVGQFLGEAVSSSDPLEAFTYEDFRALEMAASVTGDAEFIKGIRQLCPDVVLPALPEQQRVSAVLESRLGVTYDAYLDTVAPLFNIRLNGKARATMAAVDFNCGQLLIDPLLWEVEARLPANLEEMRLGPALTTPLTRLFSAANVQEIITLQRQAMQQQMESMVDALVDASPSFAVVRLVPFSEIPKADRAEDWMELPDDFTFIQVLRGWKRELPAYVPVGGDPSQQSDATTLVAVHGEKDGYLFVPVHPEFVPLALRKLGPVEWRRHEETRDETVPRADELPRRDAGPAGVVG